MLSTFEEKFIFVFAAGVVFISQKIKITKHTFHTFLTKLLHTTIQLMCIHMCIHIRIFDPVYVSPGPSQYLHLLGFVRKSSKDIFFT